MAEHVDTFALGARGSAIRRKQCELRIELDTKYIKRHPALPCRLMLPQSKSQRKHNFHAPLARLAHAFDILLLEDIEYQGNPLIRTEVGK